MKFIKRKKVHDFLINDFALIFLSEIDNWKASFYCFLDAMLSCLLLCYFIKIKLLITKVYSKLHNERKAEISMKTCKKDVSNILAGLVTFRSFLFNWDYSMQGWTATARHGVTRKRITKRLQHTGNLFRKNLQLKDVC